jgi:hypothetical protein
MKIALIFTFLICFAQLGHAAELADGLYWQTDGKSGTKITAQRGREVYAGEKWDVHPQEVTVASEDNANTSFAVSLKLAYEPRISEANLRAVLVCGGLAFAMNGSGANGKEISFADFAVEGKEHADAVAKFFGTATKLRRHPGYAFRISFTPDKNAYDPGDEVSVTLRIENISDKTIAFQQGGHNRAERDTQYRFSAHLNFKSVPDIGSDMNFGGLSVRRILKPNEVFEDKVVLNKWFALKEPGSYEVLGSYLMEFFDPEEKSGYFMLWQDFATADFRVDIKAPATSKGDK